MREKKKKNVFPIFLAKHLLKLMLEKDPEKRITTKQILTHKFVIKHFYDDSIREVSQDRKISKELDISHHSNELKKLKEEKKQNEILNTNLVESEEYDKTLISKNIRSSDESIISEEKIMPKNCMKSNNTLKPEMSTNFLLKSV